MTIPADSMLTPADVAGDSFGARSAACPFNLDVLVGAGAMTVRLTHIDGKLPNLALMRLAHWHRSQGDEIHFTRSVRRGLFEPAYDRVYGSAIFAYSADRIARFKTEFPDAIVGGTGSGTWTTLEDVVGDIPERYDYSLYPDYAPSIGFLQRGCRLRCKFCVVPRKEGRPRQTMTVAELWRGPPHPKKLHVLDNDFFGVPGWPQHIDDILRGGFRVCLNQGINVRLITDDAAAALSSIEYRDDRFSRRRIYTAWDNLKDERVFFRSIDRLEAAGIPANHVMVYMLVGYDPDETWGRIHYRFDRMVARGVLPYPMVYDFRRRDLKAFQRWAVTGLYRVVPFSEYRHNAKRAQLGNSTPLLEQTA